MELDCVPRVVIAGEQLLFLVPYFSLGTVGYIGTSYFVKKIYSTVKID